MAERPSKGRSSAEQWLRDIPRWALLQGFGVVVEVSLGEGVRQVTLFVIFLIWVEVVFVSCTEPNLDGACCSCLAFPTFVSGGNRVAHAARGRGRAERSRRVKTATTGVLRLGGVREDIRVAPRRRRLAAHEGLHDLRSYELSRP